ncbi:MAG: hypothetical protein LBU89_02775 [Fibromonadaceae bacterium]|jgi:hypothetical protein|nr:hypothetical protein [Fibromonadaceae bacterium]
MRIFFAIISLILFACSIEDPSVWEFDLQKIRLNGDLPFDAYFDKPEPYTYADKQANLYYAMINGDTIKVSICEYETAMLARAFFYSSDNIKEKNEHLIGDDRKRFMRHGRRLFIFSYMFSISENASILDSLIQFTKRFPAADTSANAGFQNFSLKNSRADEDVSVQKTYFLGVETPFNMIIRRYKDASFSWVCAHSDREVSEKDWADFKVKWQNNVYGPDRFARIGRLSNGTVVAVYGDLDSERMYKVYREFARRMR